MEKKGEVPVAGVNSPQSAGSAGDNADPKSNMKADPVAAPVVIPVSGESGVVSGVVSVIFVKSQPPPVDTALLVARARSKANKWPIMNFDRDLPNGCKLKIELSWPPAAAPFDPTNPDPMVLLSACRQYGFIMAELDGTGPDLTADQRKTLDAFTAAVYDMAQKPGVQFSQ